MNIYKLRTVDVWDTLLRRTGHPDFSKLISARAIALSCPENLAEKYRNYWKIFTERINVEILLSTKQEGGEYKIQNVLEELLRRIFIQPNDINLSALAEYYAEIEFQFEIEHTYPDPDVVCFLQRYPAERTIFLSDFYMSAEHIKQLLRCHHLDDLVEDGISSCDIGLNKRSGQLFRYVHDFYKIKPEEHVHIGDNGHADVKIPRRIGVHAVHFLPKIESSKYQLKSRFLRNREALFHHVEDSILNRLESEIESQDGVAKGAYCLGATTAVLFVGFALQIAEKSLLDKVKKLYFFTREGEFFLQVWRALFPENRLAGMQLPDVELLEVSRLATFCASLREPTIDEFMRLWSLYTTQPMVAMIKTLGLQPENFKEICLDHDLPLDEDISHPWQDSRVKELFIDPRFTTLIQSEIDRSRALLVDYLAQKGWIENTKSVAVVDIGWRGSIQDNLAFLRPKCYVYGYYLGLLKFKNSQPENCKKSAFGPDANRSFEYVNLLEAAGVIEMLTNSPNGSVTGYARNAQNEISAERVINDGENIAHYNFVTHFQRGTISAIRIWTEYIESHVISSEELRGPCCDKWRDLINDKKGYLARAYATLNHNETFGVGRFIDKNAVPTLRDIFGGIFLKKNRDDVISYIRQAQWAAGIWGRRDLGLMHRVILTSLIKLALQYKRFRYWQSVQKD